MKLINVFFFAVALMTFGACNNAGDKAAAPVDPAKQKGEEQLLWSETMAIHDRAMKLMGNMNNLKTMLSEELKNSSNQELNSIAQKAIDDLDRADEGMMEWMANLQKLDQLRKEKSHEEIMKYLGEQKQAANKVSEDITNSLMNGKKAYKAFTGE